MRRLLWVVLGLIVLGAGAFYGLHLMSQGPGPIAENERYGAAPLLPPAHPQILPTIHIASVVGWAKGAAPKAPAGFTVSRYAEGLDHPRWLLVLANGDVLAAESTTLPANVTDLTSLVGNALQKAAGGIGVSPNKIILLRRDQSGHTQKHVLLENLNQPFGMLVLGDTLYVANTDAVLAFPFHLGQTKITAPGKVIAKLPYRAGDNDHWTRNLIASADGKTIFATVGSASNIADHGLAAEAMRADILAMAPDGSGLHIFASGLRNPNGMAFEPKTGALWTVVNERDMLGDDLVPDYLTSVKEGGFYGWPFSYWGQHPDPRLDAKIQRADLIAKAITPDYALGAHVAALGLAFYRASAFPAAYQGGAFIGEHGSWNRRDRTGYKVVYVPFADGKPAGPPQDFLTGFLDEKGEAMGRPVGVVVDSTGALLVADDTGGVIWRVAAAK